jgi:hypothetical protein
VACHFYLTQATTANVIPAAMPCPLCDHLSPAQRFAMRSALIEVPLPLDAICDPCLTSWWLNLLASFPKDEEELMRRRAERAAD